MLEAEGVAAAQVERLLARAALKGARQLSGAQLQAVPRRSARSASARLLLVEAAEAHGQAGMEEAPPGLVRAEL